MKPRSIWDAAIAVCLCAAPAAAQTAGQAASGSGVQVNIGTLAGDLIGLFVVAVILETALSTLFNWRVYREFFNGRAVKTLVMVAFGYAVVTQFGYDIVGIILAKVGAPGAPGPLSHILSALVLAGGSATAYQLFKALGLRPPVEPEAAQRQPASDEAWFSVRIDRQRAVGGVEIHVERLEGAPEGMAAAPALAGVLGGQPAPLARLRALFLADPMRFPTYGGRSVKAGSDVYRISTTGLAKGAQPGDPPVPFSEVIYTGRFAPRAIVDFQRTI